MNFTKFICKQLIMAAVLCVIATPAFAVKVQVFKPAKEGKPATSVRQEAIELAFAQALLTEALRMVPGELDSQRAEALRDWLGERRNVFVSGYRDMKVGQEENGISVGLDVTVNRNALRNTLKGIGLFSTNGSKVKAEVRTSSEDQGDLAILDKLELIYGVESVKGGADTAVVINKSGKKRWDGSLSVVGGESWTAYGPSLDTVWNKLWKKYFETVKTPESMNPHANLVVIGWFSPEGVREFGRVLKGWDAAVQEVELLEVEMKPTAVSANWSLEIADQWLLKSYLNDYLPQRGLSYTINGLGEK